MVGACAPSMSGATDSTRAFSSPVHRHQYKSRDLSRAAGSRYSRHLSSREHEPDSIDSVHLAPETGVETAIVRFDRSAKHVLDDEGLGHRIYALETPLRPGESLQLDFAVRFKPRGFRNRA